ncbi:MAG TPA: hypothetical protein VJS67_12600 [Pseudonocardiaceae bacterium]|nr:hypothetical protein [Pseudonocardiaceae bacterium]
MPHQAAPSLPVASGTMPVATAAAEPADEAPGDYFHGRPQACIDRGRDISRGQLQVLPLVENVHASRLTIVVFVTPAKSTI